MDKEFYLAALRREAAAFAAAARLNQDTTPPAVPTCPGWTVTDVVLHLGSVHRRIAKMLSQAALGSAPFNRQDLSFLELPQPYLSWITNGPAPADQPPDETLLAWFEEGTTQLVNTLQATEPTLPVPSWGLDQTALHWFRAQPGETALHRWDVQNSQHQAQPIEANLATDNIDLTLDALEPRRHRAKATLPGNGETYHFHRTDGPGEWLVRFEPNGVIVRREHTKGDVALRGSASDLLLFLWRRQDHSHLEVFGNEDLLLRYFELAPTP